MDAIVSDTLSEICSQGIDGVSVRSLWPRLESSLSSSSLHLCNGVKTSIWTRLLNTPGLQFQSQNSPSFTPKDTTIQSVEDAEKLNLIVVADKHLRDCFVGLYNGDTGISLLQRRVLQRLSIARTNGVVQNQLEKELGLEGNKAYYVLNCLEVRGLIVRQPTMVRTRKNGTKGEIGWEVVSTYLIYLYRYANQLSYQQRLEITKFVMSENVVNASEGISTNDGGVKDDVLVKDYVPAMRAICVKLEEAEGKILSASDIKKALGYEGDKGHKKWRNILNRLKEAGLIEIFDAKVNQKSCRCLRLLRSFYPENGQQSLSGKPPLKNVKRDQISDQLLELPIENQIYDMIDAKGHNGLTVTEVCKQLGLNNKKSYTRLLNMFSRFGLHIQAERHNKSSQYRVWTSQNSVNGSSINVPTKPVNMPSAGNASDMGLKRNLDQSIEQLEPSISKDGFELCKRMECGQEGLEHQTTSSGDNLSSQNLICQRNPHDLHHDIRGTGSDEHPDLQRLDTGSACTPQEAATPSILAKGRSSIKYPCLTWTVENTRREQMILQRLQDEKFILLAELYRWLLSLEKDKHTTMDRKTLKRTLSKLESEGHCKITGFAVPRVTNYGHRGTTLVVLHRSLEGVLPPEFLGQLYEKVRCFNQKSRQHGLPPLKNENTVSGPNISGRTPHSKNSCPQPVQAEAMRFNGFTPAKVARGKLLHQFLWTYLHSSPDWDNTLSSGSRGYDIRNPNSTCKEFEMGMATKAMPLALFLQVVGSTEKFEDCKLGLCLNELPLQDYISLMDRVATERLSSTVDFLCRLKLIQLVAEGPLENREKCSAAPLTYAMELKPCIEESLSDYLVSVGVKSHDLCPTTRHDFVLSSKEAVDAYWATCEKCLMKDGQKAMARPPHGCATQEGVHVSNAKCQSFKLCQNDLNHHDAYLLSAHKRKTYLLEGPSKRLKPEEQCVSIADRVDLDSALQSCDNEGCADTTEESRIIEEDRENHHSFLRLKQSCRPRFQWTDASDKKLIIQYVRHRASLGARCHRIKWDSVPDLPAPPGTCQRRIHLLMKNPVVREGLMRICNLLGERYVEYMAKSQEKELLTLTMSEKNVQESPFATNDASSSCGYGLPSGLKEEKWDDFEDQNIKMALDELFLCKPIAELQDSQVELELPAATTCRVPPNHDERRQRRSSYNRLSGKFSKHLDEVINITRLAYESLAVANAVELLKLVLLNTSSSPNISNLLAKILLQYSEHDIFAAYCYLREKKYVIGGNGSQVFALSQQFLHDVSSSPFPTNTGKRATKFINWLKEREKDLMEDEIHLDDDLQCGDIFHMLALVSSESLIISPSLPDEGIGESNDTNLKRKFDNEDSCRDNYPKRMKYADNGEVVSRRAKGFPGIKVSLSRMMISKSDALELISNDKISSSDLGRVNAATPFHISGHSVSLETTIDESPWQSMAIYGDQMFSEFLGEEQRQITPELFKGAHSIIHKAGDQGVKMKEVSQALALHGERLTKVVVDVLQVFGMTIKVNAFNDIRIVDACFRSKYMLTTIEDPPSYKPILPWMNGDGTINSIVYKGLVRRGLGIVMQNPGLMEDDFIRQMKVLNPQSCRRLVELMILDNHLIVRKMHQTIYSGPPSILGCKSSITTLCRQHLFANPMSTTLL